MYTFRMRGIGYMHPQFPHGANHGELEVGGESIALDDFVPTDPSSIHIQTLCKVRMGDKGGVGVLEQLAFGPHAPTGLTVSPTAGVVCDRPATSCSTPPSR